MRSSLGEELVDRRLGRTIFGGRRFLGDEEEDAENPSIGDIRELGYVRPIPSPSKSIILLVQ